MVLGNGGGMGSKYTAALCLALAGVLLPAGLVGAQTEKSTGSRIGRVAPATPPDNTRMADEDRALQTTFEYARCLVQTDEKTFRPLLSLEPKVLSEDQRDALSQPACLRYGELRMPQPILRGAIFRAFYLKDWSRRPAGEFGEPIDYFKFIDQQDKGQFMAAAMLDFASCVIRADPANGRLFVSGIPGEPQFENALQQLVPQLGPCLPAGLEVRFSKSNLSAYFAEALYWETSIAAEAPAAIASPG